ncbi:LysM domain-containing protein, partial [Candidatus Deferrimicrobium sp.]|uniref:LysM peptidoglycan-binding domain-containing protein n=1 Tax=Candidatus Deferrimicrobium sp. TaxID=3060586 RepID=UPI002ED2981D
MKRASVNMGAFAVVCMLLLLPIGAFAQEEPAESASSSEGIVYTVVVGDTLWDLSAKYLGSPWKWTEIWERNRFITNPHYIYPGIEVVIVPPGPREIALGQEPAPDSGPAETVSAPPSVEAVKPPVPPVAPPRVPYLDIKPEDFVRAGEFLKEAPKGIGNIQGGKEPRVGFVEGDMVYLSLRKEIPSGQLLGVYRVRGPIHSPGKRSVSGYVKYLIGVIQAVPKVDGQATARVRQSFEDLTRADLISEEIPAYTPVRIDPGADGVPCSVITGRLWNKELAQGDFIYLDQGASAGVAVGNVFRVFVPTGVEAGAEASSTPGKVLFEVARAVVVRVSP